MKELIRSCFEESIETKKKILMDEFLVEMIENLAILITNTFKNGGKIVICGNGGSASDALHFAGEIVGRFQKERSSWPAVVLNADIATMTAIANDYGYDNVFARQAEAHLTEKDIFIGISTSGNSENVLRAVEVAKKRGCKTVGLLGKDGGAIGENVDNPLIIKSNKTARVQECHITIIHILCELVEDLMVHDK